MSAASPIPTSHPSTEPWHEEIVAAFQALAADDTTGYEVLSVTIDAEHLYYLDATLDEMSRRDRRLPHPTNRDRTRIRSATVDAVLELFLESREREGGSVVESGELARAMDGDLGNIFYGGVVQRLDDWGRARLVDVDLLLPPETLSKLDRELTRFVLSYFHGPEQAFYLDQQFSDFRSAFVEASLLTWLILHGLIAQVAVRSCASPALHPQERASRRRRALRLA
jgi:hypothetical protein